MGVNQVSDKSDKGIGKILYVYGAWSLADWDFQIARNLMLSGDMTVSRSKNDPEARLGPTQGIYLFTMSGSSKKLLTADNYHNCCLKDAKYEIT